MWPAGPQVKEVSENPLANNRGGKFARDALDPGEETSAMETRILESSITKICSLLAVGFGDAGAEVRALAALAECCHPYGSHRACVCASGNGLHSVCSGSQMAGLQSSAVNAEPDKLSANLQCLMTREAMRR